MKDEKRWSALVTQRAGGAARLMRTQDHTGCRRRRVWTSQQRLQQRRDRSQDQRDVAADGSTSELKVLDEGGERR